MVTITSTAEAKLISVNPGFDSIYGSDDRNLLSNQSPEKMQELARSVALITSGDNIEKKILMTTIKAETLQKVFGMCANERFVKRPSITGCTGFLVAPDVLATAGHCFQTMEDCSSKKIIFGVEAGRQTKDGYSVFSSNVFSCKEIIANAFNGDEDFALIRLDRTPKFRGFLKLNTKNKTNDDAQVFMIGHPFGLPLMLSQAVRINHNEDPLQFKTALDSFQGNSGSPVINSKTYQVEGILVNGQEDLVQDLLIGCYRNKHYESQGGEGVFRASELPAFSK